MIFWFSVFRFFSFFSGIQKNRTESDGIYKYICPSETKILQSRSMIVLYSSLIDSACWATARIPRWKRCTRTRYLIWHSRIIDDSSVAGALSDEKRASMESAVILWALGAATPSRLIYFLILSLHYMKSMISHLYTKSWEIPIVAICWPFATPWFGSLSEKYTPMIQ